MTDSRYSLNFIENSFIYCLILSLVVQNNSHILCNVSLSSQCLSFEIKVSTEIHFNAWIQFKFSSFMSKFSSNQLYSIKQYVSIQFIFEVFEKSWINLELSSDSSLSEIVSWILLLVSFTSRIIESSDHVIAVFHYQ